MKIMYYEYIEGCLDGKNVHDAFLNDDVDIDFAAYLGLLGKYSFYKEFDKPFYRIIVKSKYTIKGSLGNNFFRIILPDDELLNYLEEIKNYVKSYELWIMNYGLWIMDNGL
jgi:hypothetical protein